MKLAKISPLRGIGRGFGALCRLLGRAPATLTRRAERLSVRTRWITVVLLAVFGLAAVSATVVLGFAAQRARDIDSARADAVAGARQRVTDILSYRAETIDADIERASQGTAGAFAEYYGPFALRAIAPAVRQEGTNSVAVVSRAAAVSASTDTVVVVVFIDQQTSSKAAPQPRNTSSTARVTMTKVAGQWLVSELTPASS
jgi:Mce-associated membrane protein